MKSDLKKAVLSKLNKLDIVALAEDLITIPSLTGQEQACARYVSKLLKKEGFEVHLQEVESGRPQVIAYIRGNGKGKSLMLNGHLDSDPVTGSWPRNPFEPFRDGNRLWGAGINNMKSGLAALLAAAIAVKRADVPLAGDLVIACVVGELQGGRGTVHMLKSGIRTDMAIVAEPYSIRNIITKCVGVHKFAINTIGRSIHVSRKEKGVDAIEKMLKVISELKRLKLNIKDPDLPGVPILTVSSIIGGRNRDYDLSGVSSVADFATIIVDLRYPQGITPQEINKKIIAMLNKLKKEDRNFQYEYEHPPNKRFRVGGTDMPPMDMPADMEVVDVIRANYKAVTGKNIENTGAVIPLSYCGNDTAHLQRAGIECCLYGPRGYDEEVDKHVRIDEMVACSRVLAGCILDICVNNSR